MRTLLITLAIFGCLVPSAARTRKDVPIAPLPAAVANAKKVFLTNGGGNNLAYDAFYSGIKEWGRFEIVGSPEQADLIIDLSYAIDQLGTRVWSSTNTYNGATQVHSARVIDPHLTLTIFDPKTKLSIWSEVDHRRLATLEKNREKETIKSADRLVDDLKARIAP